MGELALFLFSLSYQASTSYDDEQSIRSKNVASGLHWGLSLAALGLLLSRALRLSQSVVVFAVWFGVGAPALLAVNATVGRLIFPSLNIEDELYTAPTPENVGNPLQMDQRMRGGGGMDNYGEAPPPVAARPPAVSPGPTMGATRSAEGGRPAVGAVVAEAFATYDKDNSGSMTKDECVDFIAGTVRAI